MVIHTCMHSLQLRLFELQFNVVQCMRAKHTKKISGCTFFYALDVLDADDAQQQWNEWVSKWMFCFSTYLLQYRSDVFQRQRRKLILLQEIVQILLEHFKHQASVILVLEALKGPHKVEFVSIFLTEAWKDWNFNLTLTSVGWMVLEDLYGDNIAGAFLPALYHLTESTTTEEFKNLENKIFHYFKNFSNFFCCCCWW